MDTNNSHMNADDTPVTPRTRDHLKRASNQLQRLGTALAAEKPRIDSRSFEPNTWLHSTADVIEPAALKLARKYAALAEEAYRHHDPDAGWAHLHSALELEILVYSQSEVAAAKVTLRKEVKHGSVSGWEAKASRALLKQAGKAAGPADDLERTLLRVAMKVRNDYFNKAYYVERIVAQRRLWLASIGIVLVAAALALGLLILKDAGVVDIYDSRVAVLSATVGMAGAVTSAIQRLVAHPGTAAPTDIGSFTAVIVRPLIGAVAALSVYLAWLGDFVRFPSETTTGSVALLTLASFGVGFAERLVVYHPPQAVTYPPHAK